MRKKVHKLTGSEAGQFKLLGISSHENDYRLSWAINRQLGLDFRKTENFAVLHKNDNKPEQLEFSMFQYITPDGILKMNLISNRCLNGFLIRDMKNIDFFLQIFGEDNQAFTDAMSKNLKSIDIVSTVFEVPRKNLKSKWDLPLE